MTSPTVAMQPVRMSAGIHLFAVVEQETCLCWRISANSRARD